jgi:hypothetical protein
MEVASCHPPTSLEFCATSGFFGKISDSRANGLFSCRSRNYQMNWRYLVLILPVMVLLTVVT